MLTSAPAACNLNPLGKIHRLFCQQLQPRADLIKPAPYSHCKYCSRIHKYWGNEGSGSFRRQATKVPRSESLRAGRGVVAASARASARVPTTDFGELRRRRGRAPRGGPGRNLVATASAARRQVLGRRRGAARRCGGDAAAAMRRRGCDAAARRRCGGDAAAMRQR